MLWVLLGALGIDIADAAGMGPAQKGLMVAIPILTGSVLRVPLGILSDRMGDVGLSGFLPLFLRDHYASLR